MGAPEAHEENKAENEANSQGAPSTLQADPNRCSSLTRRRPSAAICDEMEAR
jgi:hypothetical protein